MMNLLRIPIKKTSEEEKITLEEYENRLSNSTCMFWATAKTIKM